MIGQVSCISPGLQETFGWTETGAAEELHLSEMGSQWQRNKENIPEFTLPNNTSSVFQARWDIQFQGNLGPSLGLFPTRENLQKKKSYPDCPDTSGSVRWEGITTELWALPRWSNSSTYLWAWAQSPSQGNSLILLVFVTLFFWPLPRMHHHSREPQRRFTGWYNVPNQWLIQPFLSENQRLRSYHLYSYYDYNQPGPLHTIFTSKNIQFHKLSSMPFFKSEMGQSIKLSPTCRRS